MAALYSVIRWPAMTRPVDSNSGSFSPVGADAPARSKSGQGPDFLQNKSAAESDFQTQFTPGAVRGTPVKLGSKEYDADLWDSPMMRTLKRALSGWELPAAGSGKALGRVLKDDDVRLTPTLNLPGREAWRAKLQALIVSGGQVQAKPTAYFLAGPMGVGKIAFENRMWSQGVIPQAVVKADADYLHALVPEQSELEALGDGRSNDVVHEEASTIGRAAFEQALTEKRDVLHNTMLGSASQLERLTKAKDAGFKRVVMALVAPLEVAKQRAGADGAIFPEKALLESHRDFAKNFDEVVKGADELVLLMNTGKAMEVIAQGKAGELTVKNERAYQAFRAMKDLAT